LALDNILRWPGTLSSFGACPVAVSGSNPTDYDLLADCTTDETIVIPQNVGGSAFHGNGFSITGVDPSGGHFLGAILQAQSGPASISVDDVTVKASNLADICDPASPDTRLRGILFDGVSGSVTNTNVTDIEQAPTGESGCQEGSGIEVRNSTASTPMPNVTISDNIVTDYQKTGILATGRVATVITDNVVTGDRPIDYIAENGIQVSLKATAQLVGNDVSMNNYSPPKVTACGLLIFKAGGVSGATKSGIKYVKADNDFHNNEQDLCNFGKGGNFSPNAA
jgi:hypothetical protein